MDEASRPVSATNSILAVVMTARTFDAPDRECAGSSCFNSTAQSSTNASLSGTNLDQQDLRFDIEEESITVEKQS
ncbi:hypothetical protein [Methylocystis sp. ATCC 49242]|jgi:hypothetical protein|uniref:hypothetical protein n=1 Tax=Methylocystis sp. ATCC 49242 TaxID=622637 RepID=UPI0005625DA5|nr:hypothetical protein [Methylocystis sp. ATCC 49242]